MSQPVQQSSDLPDDQVVRDISGETWRGMRAVGYVYDKEMPEPPFTGGKIRSFTTHWSTVKHAERVYRESDVRKMLAATQVVADQPSEPAHRDDKCVDAFAIVMKAKLASARRKGRSGWEGCDSDELSNMLRHHVEKGDPRDVANFCMFLWCLNQPISESLASSQPIAEDVRDAVLSDSDENAPWLTAAHMLCTDQGIPQGHISWRLEVLRGLIEAEPKLQALLDQAQELDMGYGSQPQHPPCHVTECGTTGAVDWVAVCKKGSEFAAGYTYDDGCVSMLPSNKARTFLNDCVASLLNDDDFRALFAAPAAQHMAHNDGGEVVKAALIAALPALESHAKLLMGNSVDMRCVGVVQGVREALALLGAPAVKEQGQ